MDGRLFLVRHLLILKEMTAGLDLGSRMGRRDWGGLTGEFVGMGGEGVGCGGGERVAVVRGWRWGEGWLWRWG